MKIIACRLAYTLISESKHTLLSKYVNILYYRKPCQEQEEGFKDLLEKEKAESVVKYDEKTKNKIINCPYPKRYRTENIIGGGDLKHLLANITEALKGKVIY